MNAGEPGDGGDADPDSGLQRERTYLAWQRTGLSFAALGGLLAHVADGLRRPFAAAPGLFSLAVGISLMVWATLRHRAGHAASGGKPGAAGSRAMATVSAATLVLCVSLTILMIVEWWAVS